MVSTLLLFSSMFSAGQVNAEGQASQTKAELFQGEISLSTTKAHVNTPIHFRAEGLEPSKETSLSWRTVEGSYELEGVYQFIGTNYVEKIIPLINGKSDANGVWEGDFTVPKGFGGNHTLYVKQGDQLLTQANIHVKSHLYHLSNVWTYWNRNHD